MPRVEKVWRIIYWIISVVTGATEVGVVDGESMEEELVVSGAAVMAW